MQIQCHAIEGFGGSGFAALNYTETYTEVGLHARRGFKHFYLLFCLDSRISIQELVQLTHDLTLVAEQSLQLAMVLLYRLVILGEVLGHCHQFSKKKLL